MESSRVAADSFRAGIDSPLESFGVFITLISLNMPVIISEITSIEVRGEISLGLALES